jgi:hypothetical protein
VLVFVGLFAAISVVAWIDGRNARARRRKLAGDCALFLIKKRTGHLHNTPVQILVERGLLGLTAWLWIWGAFYRRVGRLLRRLPVSLGRERALVAGSLAAVTGFLVHGLSEYNFGDSETVMVA